MYSSILSKKAYLSLFALLLTVLACHLPGSDWWVDVDDRGDIVIDTDSDGRELRFEAEPVGEASGSGEQNGEEAVEEEARTITVQINLNSTSDWMALSVVSGGRYGSVELLSSSGTVTFAGLSDDTLALNQPLELGRAGETVDALFRVEFTGVDPEDILRFYLGKGDYGTSRATFYSESQADTALVSEFIQVGKTDHPLNQLSFEIPVKVFISP